MKAHVITGPPASGKSHYIRRHYFSNDLVFELDAILEAVCPGAREYEQARYEALPIAIEMLQAGFRVLDSHGWPGTVWFSTCSSDSAAKLALRFDCEVTTLDGSDDVRHQHDRLRLAGVG